jgi:plasmid rolling circle replication initiator protein Rep
VTPEIQSKIAVWRQKALDGTLTLEEMKEAVKLMREGRVSAASASDSSRRKTAKAEIKSADEMLDELGTN